ncbi:hypothetical protein C0583_04675 [Candidatus Parcubacteria bacterium]|nr:MAG: hypothetical protein C0583_04675 [Candidatus Parcubacteria bacterium]
MIIVVRKFSVLASLDVETIQAEKEARFKEQIISNRLKRNVIRYNSKFVNNMKPVILNIGSFFTLLYKKLLEFKDNYNKEAEETELSEEKVLSMTEQAEELVKDEKFEEAEKVYIDLISKDSQNLEAFKGLGRLYAQKKQYREAKQTFEHILRLIERDESEIEDNKLKNNDQANDPHFLSSINFELAEISKDNEEYSKAMEYIKSATKTEPNNPRYLDMKLEISIINKDKATALDAFDNLKKVNPENKKLEVFDKKIKEI